MVINSTEEEEKVYLESLLRLLNETINRVDRSVREHVDTLQEYKDYLWSNKDIDPQEIRSMRESILNHFASGESVIDKRRRLSKIADTPCFGRIDFREKKAGSRTIPVYVGIHTFYDNRSKTNLIYDWRAPISGMFYDHELGDATYVSPAGEITGRISLKRQYRIRQGKMEYMIENSLTIRDDILQKELSSNGNDKMRNIVTTIQREQNRIIRNEKVPVLIIQGVAGSGKTSVALHRIAYLLYSQRGIISSGDILIVSPNRVFADYISNVLPELGEETVPQISMEEILSGILGNRYKHQSFFESVAELLESPDPGLLERTQYKASLDFISQLDKFIIHLENRYFRARDVKLTPCVTVPAGFIEEQFNRFGRYPLRRRFEAMTEYMLEMMQVRYRFTVSTAEKNRFKKEVKKMFTGNQDIQVYKDFFDWIGRPDLFKMRKNRVLEYADLAPLAYLHIALDGNAGRPAVRHLLIDEMQDYAPIQYKVIQKLYACRKTILGDAGQSVNPYGSSTAAMIRNVFATGEIKNLYKSYRSTTEITGFAQKIRPNGQLEAFGRHGEKPQVLAFGHADEELTGIGRLISTFGKTNYKSLGIICKTEIQAKMIFDRLSGNVANLYFLSAGSVAFPKGVIVTSSHMAKGLEFDEVIVPGANDKNFCSEIDKSMLYVAVTRAMHKLALTYTGKRSVFIP